MERGGSYVQFTPLQEAFFTVQHALRPKFEYEYVDKMSISLSYILVTLRFVVEFLQLLPLMSVSEDLLRCDKWWDCILYYVAFPLNALSDINSYIELAVVGVFFILMCALAFFVFFSAFTVRKRDINVTRFRYLSVAFSLIFCTYFSDILTLNLRSYFCHFISDHFEDRSSTKGCSGNQYEVRVLFSTLSLICMIPTGLVVGLLSPAFDFRRLSGRVTSVRIDLGVMVWKVVVSLCGVILHSSEHIETIDGIPFHEHKWALRTGFSVVCAIVLLAFTWYFVLQTPHTRDYDNRARAGILGALFGVSIINAAHSIMMISHSQDDDDTTNGFEQLGEVQAIAGAIFGALAGCISVSRKQSLGAMLQKDINVLTGTFDPDYAKHLITILETTSEEDLDGLCGLQTTQTQNNLGLMSNIIHGVSNNKPTSPLSGPLSPKVESKPHIFTIAHQQNTAAAIASPVLPPLGLVNGASSISSKRFPGTSAVASPKMSMTKQDVSSLMFDKPSEAKENSVFSTSQRQMAIMDSPAQVPPPLHVAPEATTEEEQIILRQNQIALNAARQRLAAYMTSQSFHEIHRSLNLHGDMELVLRTLSEEWNDLAEPQKDVARTAVIQLFAALYLKTQRGQDDSLPSGYFLWFAATAIVLWKDIELATEALRIASEGGHMGWDDAFLCYLLQKACEDIRNNTQNSKRTSGVSDMAAFRRWTTAARTLHEKALASLKRFFKSSLQSSHWNYITIQESDRNLSSSELKAIHDTRDSLDEALGSLRAAESAYDNLMQRYPSVPVVATMVTSFKRQFFRDAANNLKNHGDKSAAGAAGRPLDDAGSQNNSSKGGTSIGESSADNSFASMGSGFAETPKQLLLTNVTDTVMRSFNRARLWSFLSLFVVIVISCVLLLIAILELLKVTDWLDMFRTIFGVFNLIPSACMQAFRPVIGSTAMGAQFFTPARVYLTQNIDAQQRIYDFAGANAVKDTAQLKQICDDYLVWSSAAYVCHIAFLDKDYVSRGLNPVTGALEDNKNLEGVQFWDLNAPNHPKDEWFKTVIKDNLERAAPTAAEGARFYNGFVQENEEDVVTYKYVAMPFYYAPPTAVGSAEANPTVQGVFMIAAKPNANEVYSVEYVRRLEATILNMQTASASFETEVRRLGVSNIREALEGNFFNVQVFNDKAIRSPRDFTFSEGVGYFATQLTELREVITSTWNPDKIRPATSRLNYLEFCSSANVIDSQIVLELFLEHLNKTINASTLIISICAVGAVLTAIFAAVLTTRLVRNFLKEFDRSDGVTPSLAMVATFPKSELRRVAKAINGLRLDRGIFDPDDEHAAFMDLTVSRSTQRYQDALLRARQIANERDRELNDEFGGKNAASSPARSFPAASEGNDLFDVHESEDMEGPAMPSNRDLSFHKKSWNTDFDAAADDALIPVDEEMARSPLYDVSTSDDEDGHEDESIVEFSNLARANSEKSSKGKKTVSQSNSLPKGSSRGRVVTSPKAAAGGKVMMGGTVTHAVRERLDEESTVASSKRTGSSTRSSISMPKKMANAVLRRPVSRAFLGIWIVIMAYVAMALVICIISVGRYIGYYEAIGGLMMVSFNAAVSSVFSVHYRIGAANYAQYSTPFPQFKTWIDESKNTMRNQFFATVDKKSVVSEQTLGRANEARTKFLYEPTCMPVDITGVKCDDSRSQFDRYINMKSMQQGLVRAIISWTDYVDNFLLHWDHEVVTDYPTLDSIEVDFWFISDSLDSDLEPGIEWLRVDILNSTLDAVDTDTTTEIFLLAGAIIVGVAASIFMEWSVRVHVRMFKDSLLLLRMLPSRLLDDYKVIHKVLTIKEEEDEM